MSNVPDDSFSACLSAQHVASKHAITHKQLDT
eukprot:COSAG02_NODE_43966_length_370_cov_0.693727_1_plen_31_part_10